MFSPSELSPAARKSSATTSVLNNESCPRGGRIGRGGSVAGTAACAVDTVVAV